MREIKFRVWDELAKEIIPVKSIYFDEGDGNLMGVEAIDDDVIYFKEELEKRFSLMQYTGLKDKNGVEIFEGDIVKVISSYGYEEISDVVFGLSDKRYGNYPAFCMPKIETELNSFSAVFDSGDYEIEIIGNIYENPELSED